MTTDPFGDPRIAALYDDDNPPGDDHAFFRRTVARALEQRGRPGGTVVDLGCGTGSLTVTLASPVGGVRPTVHGIDPSAAMLDIARVRPGGELVRWHLGDASRLPQLVPSGSVDAVTMTGNVAQHIVGDAWPVTLAAIAGALRSGGVLTFETRNPADRAWESWTPDATRGRRPTAFGWLTEWLEVTTVEGAVEGAVEGGAVDGVEVTFIAHNVWEDTGEHQALESRLVFRDRGQLAADLAAAGLTVAGLDGGWHGEPVTDASRVLVVTATA